MTALMSNVASLMLQAARTLPDTIYTKQVDAAPGIIEKLGSIANVIVALMLIVLLVVLIPVAKGLRNLQLKMSGTLDKFRGAIDPVIRHAGSIADNVDYISSSVRVDVQQVSKTINAANQGLMKAVSAAEARINQLNALLEVVQEEAESAFVTTASTLRGVRTGINHAFDREDVSDGYYDEAGADDDEEPRPRLKPRAGSGRP